jgi:hypothetical protein
MNKKKPKRTPKPGRPAGGCLERLEERLDADVALTPDEFMAFTGMQPAYLAALLREGVLTEAVVRTADGPRISLVALPMLELVSEVGERVANGGTTLKQAAHIIDEIRPLVPQLWRDEIAGQPSRVKVEFPKSPEGVGQTDFDLEFVRRSVARWVAGTPWLLRRRGVAPKQRHAVAR